MRNYKVLSDEALFERTKSGDGRAFATLYDRYKMPLIALALKKLDNSEVEDLIHDLFAALWNKRQTIDINKQFRSYIYRSLRNKIIDLIAHQLHERKYLDSLQALPPDYDGKTDYPIREEFFLKELHLLFAKYNPVDQTILQMRIEGFSNDEIAKQLNLSEKTIRNKYSLLIRSLRNKMKILLLFYFF